MISKGIRKHMSNPVIGLIPFIVFIILNAFGTSTEYSLIACFALTIVGESFIRFYYKSRGFSITFYISAISILITSALWLALCSQIVKPFSYVVIFELCVILSFMILRAGKVYIAARFFRQKNPLQKALMNEFYDSAILIQYALTLHFFVIALYYLFVPEHFYTTRTDLILFAIIPILIILVIGIYQIIKVKALVARLRKEKWLPIVTEKGEVTGKIAKSVSLNMKNRFLHPVVRVALIADSKVYLQERENSDILNPGKLDYPFEKYMLFNHEINLAARNSIRRMIGDEIDISLSFLLKYVFENDDTKRLIFFFVAKIEDEDTIKRYGRMKGKFWTLKQLEEHFADEIFSECFELEFEYLKNMVLTPSDIFAKPK